MHTGFAHAFQTERSMAPGKGRLDVLLEHGGDGRAEDRSEVER